MNQQLITIIVVVAQTVITYLLTQPEVVIPAPVKVALGAAAVGLTALARFLPSPGTPVTVEVKGPVTTTDSSPVIDPD